MSLSLGTMSWKAVQTMRIATRDVRVLAALVETATPIVK